VIEHALKPGPLPADSGELLAKDLPAVSFFEGL
jgi:hypothetical protein